MELFLNGDTRITAKLHRTDLIICCHSREWKTSSYSRRNTASAEEHDNLLIIETRNLWCNDEIYDKAMRYQQLRPTAIKFNYPVGVAGVAASINLLNT